MKNSERYLVVFNPVAGKGAAVKKRDAISRLMDAEGLDWEISDTEGPGHARDLARNSAEKSFTVTVSAGGDGTANEVVNGLMEAQSQGKKTPALAVMPIGRGNDFAYGADIPEKLEDAVSTIAAAHKRPMDIGIIKGGDYPDGKYFCNGIGVGFDTMVGLEAAKMKRVHGAMAYMLGAARCFINFPDAPLASISFNGSSTSRYSHQISIMNGRRMGGSFYMAPNAKNDDGLFDICASHKVKRLSLIRMMIHYVKGSQENDSRFLYGRAPSYILEAEEGGFICHADGETICINGKNLEVNCIPNALMLVYKPEYHR